MAERRSVSTTICHQSEFPALSDRDDLTVNWLIERWQAERDRGARDAVIQRFLPLARRLAGRYDNPYEPLEDLVQVAAVGLLGAIERFDPDRGVSFGRFATLTIRGELKHHFRNTGWSVHVPRGTQELALRISRATHSLSEQLGRSPRPIELARFLELGVDDVIVGLDAAKAHFSRSLDAPQRGSSDGEAETLSDRLGSVDGGYELIETKLSMAAAMPRLSHQERTALQLRLSGNRKQSDIAREMHCSQMQVSRLLRQAAERVRELTDPAF
jgi:RNA polymerase sigma-B factor